MSTLIKPNDNRISWHGAVSLEVTPEYVHPWRIPFPDSVLFEENLRERSGNPAGVRVAFRSDTSTLGGAIWASEESALFDLTVDDELIATIDVQDAEPFRFDALPPGEKLIELWFPPFPHVGLRHLEIDEGATLEPFEDSRPKWITYGSSITHCRTAESPVYTWPAVVARKAGFNHTNLGYGGQCHLDALIATTMRDLPSDYVSMCVGINIMGAGSLNRRTFRTGIIGFVRIVRERHPETPFIIMSPIYNPPRESTPNAVGMTLEIMREDVESAVVALRDHGDENVFYVNGLDIMGPNEIDLLPDQLHPGPEGYKVMGERFYERAVKPIFLEGRRAHRA